MEKLLTDFATLLDNRFRSDYITALQASVHSTFDGTNDDVYIPTYRLLEIIDRIDKDDACLPEQNAVECLVNLTDTTDRPIPEISEALKKRIIDEVALIVGFPYTGHGADGAAYPVASGQPWDNPSVTARQLWDGVPFVYDRVGAANCAINTSRSNFETTFPFGSASLNNCSISGLTVPNGVGSSVTYSLLRHVGANNAGCVQSTGSAVFISEMIFRGGKLPMVAEIGFACPETVNANNWLICKQNPSATNFEATFNWRDHFGIIQFFNGTAPNDVGTLPPQVPIGSPPDATDGLQSYMTFFSGGDNGKWRQDLAQAGQDYLYNLFKTGSLAQLETGDYVFHYLGAGVSSHGFIIVGWGDAVEADLGLNAGLATTQAINLTRPRNPYTQEPLNSIPYVADFVYGYSDGEVGWLQDPRPRPFYASLSEMSNSSTQLSNIAAQLGYSSNFQDQYLGRLRGAYRRFLTEPGNPLNPDRIPGGWLFFRFPSLFRKPFAELFPAPIQGVC